MDKVKELECTHRGELRLRLVRHFPWVIPIYRFQTESEGGSSLAILAKDFKPLTLDWVLFYVGLLSLVLIEAGYYLPSESFPRFMLGALWFVIAVPFLISTLVVSIQSLFEKELWKSSEGAWYLCALIFPLLAASFGLGGVRWLMANNEGICQVSIARDCMGQDYSFGITNFGEHLVRRNGRPLLRARGAAEAPRRRARPGRGPGRQPRAGERAAARRGRDGDARARARRGVAASETIG